MKVVFTQLELRWLQTVVVACLPIAVQKSEEDSGKLVKLLGRLRQKFTPNASYVQLKQSERDFLAYTINYRISRVSHMSDEMPLLESLKDKVEGPANE